MVVQCSTVKCFAQATVSRNFIRRFKFSRLNHILRISCVAQRRLRRLAAEVLIAAA